MSNENSLINLGEISNPATVFINVPSLPIAKRDLGTGYGELFFEWLEQLPNGFHCQQRVGCWPYHNGDDGQIAPFVFCGVFERQRRVRHDERPFQVKPL